MALDGTPVEPMGFASMKDARNFIDQYKDIDQFKVYGNTNYSDLLSTNYINLDFKKKLFQSSSKTYLKNFINIEKKKKSNT